MNTAAAKAENSASPPTAQAAAIPVLVSLSFCHFLNDLSIAYTLTKKINRTALLQFYVLNFMDVKYEPNGYTYSYVYGGTTTTSNNYFPMAGRNFLLSLKLDFK